MSSSAAGDGSFVDYGPRVVAILTPMIVLVTVVIGLRTLVVLRRHSHLNIDDWLAIGAFALTWALYGATMAFVVNGGMKQSSGNADDTSSRARYIAKIQFVCEMLYAIATMLAKASVLAIHWRLFPTKAGRWAYLTLGVLTVGWGITLVVLNVVKCHPIAKTFDPSLPGTCLDGEQFFSGFGIPNIVTDGAILVLAVYQVMRLHLPRFKRASLVAVFLLGAATISAACVRMTWFCKLSAADEHGASAAVVAKAEANAYLWSVLEVDLCLICASIPAWGPLVSHLGDRLWSVWLSSSSSKGDSTNKSTRRGKGSAVATTIKSGRASPFGLRRHYASHRNSILMQPQQNQQGGGGGGGGGYYYNVSGQSRDGNYDQKKQLTGQTGGSGLVHGDDMGKSTISSSSSTSKQPLHFETTTQGGAYPGGAGHNATAMGAVYSSSSPPPPAAAAVSPSQVQLQQAHLQFCYPQQHQQDGATAQGTPNLFTPGYGGEHYVTVRKTSSILSDEVPYGSIAVKTVVEQV